MLPDRVCSSVEGCAIFYLFHSDYKLIDTLKCRKRMSKFAVGLLYDLIVDNSFQCDCHSRANQGDILMNFHDLTRITPTNLS